MALEIPEVLSEVLTRDIRDFLSVGDVYDCPAIPAPLPSTPIIADRRQPPVAIINSRL